MASIIRKVIVAAAKVLLAMILVFGLFFGYCTYAERSAVQKVAAFCQDIEIGADAQPLQDKALEAGADSHQTKWFTPKDGNPQLTATFTGAFPLSRHICWIEAKEGRVISRQVEYLD